MKVCHIIGADLSKATIDLVCHESRAYVRIDNSVQGFKQMLHWFVRQRINATQAVVVMEHTGLYSYHLERFLHGKGIAFTKVPALAIKRSGGLLRGKNDKVDAERIARYGYEKKDVLTCTARPDPALERLQLLPATRERLVRHRASILCAVKQYRGILKKTDLMVQAQLTLIQTFTVQIKSIEAEIQKVTNASPGIKHNRTLLQSITGVGRVLAVAAIVKTKNFTAVASARKFGCYCGVAPFEHTSGSSVRGRTRVSHLADKAMKTLLDQSAKSAVQHDNELKAYFKRRLQMGKSKQSTPNVVRNKILYRMFAVIKRGTPFVENYLPVA
jgi:transposase